LSFEHVFHVIRTVRKASFLGKEAAVGAEKGTSPVSTMSAFHLASMSPLLAANPELAAVVGILIATGLISQLNQPGLGIVFPDSLGRPWEYADKVRRLTLERMYGKEQGDRMMNLEWNTRTTMIDLRAKASP